MQVFLGGKNKKEFESCFKVDSVINEPIEEMYQVPQKKNPKKSLEIAGSVLF